MTKINNCLLCKSIKKSMWQHWKQSPQEITWPLHFLRCPSRRCEPLWVFYPSELPTRCETEVHASSEWNSRRTSLCFLNISVKHNLNYSYIRQAHTTSNVVGIYNNYIFRITQCLIVLGYLRQKIRFLVVWKRSSKRYGVVGLLEWRYRSYLVSHTQQYRSIRNNSIR